MCRKSTDFPLVLADACVILVRMVKKRLRHNKKYQNIEQRILKALLVFYREQGGTARITGTAVARKAGITRSAFYLHYHDVGKVLEENCRITLEAVHEITERYQERGGEPRFFLRELLVCVHRNRLRFEIEHARESVHLWRLILTDIRPVVTRGWTSYGQRADDALYRRYAASFIGIVYEWGEQGYSETSFDRCLSQLVSLSRKRARMQG